MIAILYIVIFLAATAVFVKSILFWVYLWQVKEYRLDRFRAEYGNSPKILRFWTLSGGRKIYRPVWTKKAIVICAAAFLAIELLALTTPLNPDLFYLYLAFLLPGKRGARL